MFILGYQVGVSTLSASTGGDVHPDFVHHMANFKAMCDEVGIKRSTKLLKRLRVFMEDVGALAKTDRQEAESADTP